MRIRYNAPVVLSYAVAAAAVTAIDSIWGADLARTLAVPGGFDALGISNVRLITHVLGHAGWAHLIGNFTLILLIGPILEEKYGSGRLLLLMAITALITGGLHVLFQPANVIGLGASGIVFMMILLSSFTNIRSGDIPLTFVLVVVIFLTGEVVGAFSPDSISQLAHIAGGLCGSVFGFAITRAAPQLAQPAEPTDHLEE